MMRLLNVVVVLLMGLFAIPETAFTQGSSAAAISGVVKDASGAVLPGVTVEASSPVLIEKVRTTVTDVNGEYRIIELRPGTYAVVFTLPGFRPFRRDELELPSNFTATINANLEVGGIEETITVSGATPLVDTQNVTQRTVISRTIMDAVPTAKSVLSIAALMPAVITPPNAQDVGGTKGEQSVRISVHGSATRDSRLMQDGLLYNNLAVEGTGRGYYVNPLQMTETIIDTGAGGNAQYALGGAVVNAIPRDGGNQFNGAAFGSWAGHQLQGDNFTDELRDQGLTSVNEVRNVYDLNAVFGGPIKSDKLWFLASIRRSGGRNRVANLYYDLTPDSFLFTPMDGKDGRPFKPVEPLETLKTQSIRLAYQATSKDKLTFHFEPQQNIRDQLTGQLDRGTTAIEANGSYCTPTTEYQWGWTRPHTNRVLFESGVAWHKGSYGANMGRDTFLSDYEQCGDYLPDNVSINDSGYGFTYHGTGLRGKNNEDHVNGRVSASYVTGSHNVKVGTSFLYTLRVEGYSERNPLDVGGLPVSYSFRLGVPQSLTQFVTPGYNERAVRDLGLFVQDQWRINRVTLSYGLRYDYNRAYAPAFTRPAGPLSAEQSFAATSCTPCWHDISPRFGVAWDVFGDGRTAAKFGLNRYVQAATTGLAGLFAPDSTTIGSTTRQWIDADGDFYPDCDLRAPGISNECRAMAQPTFGQNIVTRFADPGWITGWGKRPYTYAMSLSLDRQIATGLAIGGGFYRTWFGNFTIQDDLNLTPADYDHFCVIAPTDPRLGDRSGQNICGLYNLNPAKFGQPANTLVTFTSANNPLTGQPYGNPTEVYKGADVTIAARFQGINVNGGWNIGNAIQTGIIAGGATSSSTDNCFVVDDPEQLRDCKVDNPYQSRFKVSASYLLPWWGIQTAVVYQNLPSINYGALRSYSNAEIIPSLGRPLSGGASRNVQLLAPFSAFVEERINQLDARLTKIVRVGTNRRVQLNLDVYNLFNESTVLALNNTYSPSAPNGGAWLTPTQILDARFAKFSVQFDF
ncbi:MAG TPA: carboxypeptidase regulatory-like domain-containing protein [Vicinamibacterales bacterium]|nr:carboxypeptidase regulatory-like domain-containing protein [Vicinamibacterales bacterium]